MASYTYRVVSRRTRHLTLEGICLCGYSLGNMWLFYRQCYNEWLDAKRTGSLLKLQRSTLSRLVGVLTKHPMHHVSLFTWEEGILSVLSQWASLALSLSTFRSSFIAPINRQHSQYKYFNKFFATTIYSLVQFKSLTSVVH